MLIRLHGCTGYLHLCCLHMAKTDSHDMAHISSHKCDTHIWSVLNKKQFGHTKLTEFDLLLSVHFGVHRQQVPKLENVFVKQYAPDHMPAPKDNRGIIKILWNLSKSWSGHLHLGHNLFGKYHDSRSSGSPNILFTRSFKYESNA